MPTIPDAYQSRLAPPETSRLPMADPGIVGGEPILQGAQRLQQSLLHLFSVQEQQAQVDQITLAGEIYGQVKMSLVQKKQELEMRQRQSPVNPMLLSQEYSEFATKLNEGVREDPRLAGKPHAQKYLSTHLAPSIAGDIAQYMGAQNKAWEDWKKVENAKTFELLRNVSIENPADLAQVRALADAGVHTGLYRPEEADKIFKDIYDDVYEQIGLNFARAHAPEWQEARRAGRTPTGFNPKPYGREAMARFDTAATSEMAQRHVEEEQNRQAADRRLKEIHAGNSALLTAKYLDHADNPAAPPLREKDIAALLKTVPPQIDDNTGRALYGLLKADLQHAEAQRGEDNYMAVFKRVTLPWGHPDKITTYEEATALATEERNGVVTRKLTVPQLRQLHEDIELGKTDAGAGILKQRDIFLDGQKAKIDKSNPLMGVNDQTGKEEYSNFMKFVIAKEKEYRDAKKNPAALYNEASNEFLGQYTHLYEKPLQESIDTMMGNFNRPPRAGKPSGTTVEPRKPGETPQQYMERTRK